MELSYKKINIDKSEGLTAYSNVIFNGYTALVNGNVVVGSYIPQTSETQYGNAEMKITTTSSKVYYSFITSLPTPTKAWRNANVSYALNYSSGDYIYQMVTGSFLSPGSSTDIITFQFRQRSFDQYEVWTIGLSSDGLSLIATKQRSGSGVSGDGSVSDFLYTLTFVAQF